MIASVAGNENTVTGLAAGTVYEAYVHAWKGSIDNREYIGSDSPAAYAYTAGAKRYTNPAKVTISKTELTIRLGKTASIKASVTGAEKKKTIIKKAKKLRYYSDDTAVATVTSAGKVKAVGKGSCKIYALANNGVYETVSVTVDMSPTGIKLTGVNKTLYAGDTMSLSGKVKLTPANSETELSWYSSDEKVAKVDEKSGEVTGVGDGRATITVSTSNGKQAKVTITVKTSPTAIAFKKGPTTVTVNDTLDLGNRLKLTPADTVTGLTWESSKPEVATVDQRGKVTGVAKGKTTITVTATNGKKASLSITVK